MTTLFPTTDPAKKGKPRTPPAAWVVRHLAGLGIDAAGMDAKQAFARLAAAAAARDAEGKGLSADDPACQGPDGWPAMLRVQAAHDLSAAIADDPTAERLLGQIEGVLPATTRAERVRIVHGLVRMLGGGVAARPEETPKMEPEPVKPEPANPAPAVCAGCLGPLDSPHSGTFCLKCDTTNPDADDC